MPLNRYFMTWIKLTRDNAPQYDVFITDGEYFQYGIPIEYDGSFWYFGDRYSIPNITHFCIPTLPIKSQPQETVYGC